MEFISMPCWKLKKGFVSNNNYKPPVNHTSMFRIFSFSNHDPDQLLEITEYILMNFK